MAIEIITKPKIKIPKGIIILLVFGVLALLIAVAVYFYINILSNDLKNQIAEKEGNLAKTDEERNLEEYVNSQQARISNFASLLSAHKKEFNVFMAIEALTHPNVQFLSFNFSIESYEVLLAGKAKSFLVLGQQIAILQKETAIKNLDFSGMSINSEGGVNFNLKITLDTAIFQ